MANELNILRKWHRVEINFVELISMIIQKSRDFCVICPGNKL